jgi:hypothetical protein
MFKAQADILSAVIIIVLALALTSAALLWGFPLIEKTQDTALVARVHNAFNQELPAKITHVADLRGSLTFSMDVDGIWSLNEINNTISFTFFSRATDKGLNQWIGEGCPFGGQSGTMGISKPYVLCVFVSQIGSGFNITYQLGFRELATSDGTRGYKIVLVKPAGGVSASTGKNILITYSSIDQLPSVGQKTLITTKIEILL